MQAGRQRGIRMNGHARVCAALIASFVLLIAAAGCGSGSGTGTRSKSGTSDRGQASPQSSSGKEPRGIVGTQPGAPCRPVPDELVHRIVDQLNSKIKVGDVWQMVQARNVHELGLDDPYFISARVTVAPDPATYGSWTVQDLKTGAVIPLDGPAKAGTNADKSINPDRYEDLVTNADYTHSRACAQSQYELKQQARQQ